MKKKIQQCKSLKAQVEEKRFNQTNFGNKSKDGERNVQKKIRRDKK